MRLSLCYSLVLVGVFCPWCAAQNSHATSASTTFLALQTHMPTKSGNVPHMQPTEETGPNAQPKIKLDPDQLQREGKELLELSQSLQADIESVTRGLHPKDTSEKLKRIQKLAKHLREDCSVKRLIIIACLFQPEINCVEKSRKFSWAMLWRTLSFEWETISSRVPSPGAVPTS